jgi:ABC-type Zn uptake system ZnuABC Zn-binding protein ZnuA
MAKAETPKRIRWVLAVGVIAAVLVGYSLWPRARGGSIRDDGKLQIVCSFLPVYILTQNVVGDTAGVEVRLLVERDVGCPHSYSLTGRDLKLISGADLLVANGLGAEPFLEQLTRGQRRLKMLTISDDCDLIHTEGGENGEHEGHDHDAEHDHEAAHAGHGHEECEANPHTWVSPRQAAKQVRTLGRKLAQEDPAHAESYRANAEAYAARLEALAQRMEKTAKGFANRNIVTGHASFDYLARDLGLNVVATLRVIPGESGSATEMARVIDTIRRTKAAAVFWEPPFGDKVAETVARETGVAIYPLNPFNTVSGLPEAKTPEDQRRMYEDVMDQNLATLRRALADKSAPAGGA